MKKKNLFIGIGALILVTVIIIFIIGSRRVHDTSTMTPAEYEEAHR